MKVRRYGRTDPGEPVNGPTSNPDADELAQLRKEKAEREAADRAQRDAELEELRQFKADAEKKAASAVKAPAKKVDKQPETESASTTPVKSTPARKRGRGGASRWWFGDDED